ncbi:MAG TPA: CoA transferase [Chloroflexi bacterium]|nr:CoA transferase [Chloroflexota bacterium]
MDADTTIPRLALNQLRVLDLSLLLPGPYSTRILADFGAEVIKIERPGGSDWVRHTPPLRDGVGLLFHALNRGKKSLTLNLKSNAGRELFLRLVETADVLVESFRSGVMERLGVGYERLSRVNPHLVYCSLSGYGPFGPYRERPGHDLNYAGLAGLLDLTGPRDGPPVVLGAPIADIGGALWAAVGILLALLVRERSDARPGQRVDASLLGGALACMPLAIAHAVGGQPLARGASALTGGAVCYTLYETQDGGYVTLAALEPQFWAAFCRAVGREDLIGEQFAPAAPGQPVYDALCVLFKTRTRQGWVEALEGIDACCEPVYAVAEAIEAAPVEALGMLSDAGLLPPVQLSAQPARPPRPAPALGAHTDGLLRELGYDDAVIASLRQQAIV